MKVDSVSGFSLESADPSSLDNTEWKLNTLNKAQGGRINIKGLISSDTGSHLNFSAKLGMWQNGTFIVLKEANQDVEVINPLVFISEQVNNSANHVAFPGEKLHYEVFFRNIGTTSFDNLFVTSKIDGFAFDLSTLTSNQGQVRANDNLIIWDFKQVPELQHLLPNREISVTFDVKLKDNWVPSDSEKNNILLKNTVNVFDITQEFNIKVNSNLGLSQKAYYASQGGFQNSGTVPPKVNKSTTYIIVWQVKNYFNDVKNIKVRAVLPQGVTLTAVLPDNQISNFSLDSASREIVWLAGNLAASKG